MNKILSYICFIAAAVLFVCGFFKGTHVFIESIGYFIIGSCFSDTYKREKEEGDEQ